MAIFLKAHWEKIVMANYRVAPEMLQPFMPKGVELDLYQGNAYVSLVGFLFNDIRIFNIPSPLYRNFEEVNLRFYVVRKMGNELRRGVVFINETVPNKAVAWVANKLYKEHYTAVPTRHRAETLEYSKHVTYEWQVANRWNSLSVNASTIATSMKALSFEEFIFEHYFGYTKVSDSKTEEYRISHPSWKVNDVLGYKIQCDFQKAYGSNFADLSLREPDTVFIAEGSAVAIDWKRIRLS